MPPETIGDGLELLKVLVREIPSWSEAVERVAPREQNQLVRRAFEICSETHHRDAVASLFADFVAGRAPDDELPLFVLLDAADLQRHWHEVVQLMKSDN